MIAVMLLASSCSGPQPKLYQVSNSSEVETEKVTQDIQECEREAKHLDAQHALKEGKDIAKDTAKGGLYGGAIGGAVGAVHGHAGLGAATGAASLGVTSFLNSIFSGPRPNSAKRRYVEQCLRERGYGITGWE